MAPSNAPEQAAGQPPAPVIQIALATPADTKALAKVFTAAVAIAAAEHLGLTPVAAFAKATPQSQMRAKFKDLFAGRYIFKATIADRIVGVAILNGKTGWLEGLHVDPDYFCLGAGRALFTAAESQARELGVRVIHLEASAFAEGFFKKMACRYTDGRRREHPSQSADLAMVCIAMCKAI